MRLVILTLLPVIFLAGCGTPRRGENIAAPLAFSTEKEARGEKYFMTYCNKCHPQGESGVGFAINNKPLPGPIMKTQVRLGAGAMPAFSKEFLSDDKLDDIIAYLQTIRKH